jgi:hypothetical protein
MSGNVSGMMGTMVKGFTDSLGDIGSTLFNLFSDPQGAIKELSKIGSGVSKLWMAKNIRENQKRPRVLELKAILTGEPVGEWHLTVGNPFNPFMSIGNLIVTNTTLTFSDQLGVDDFPDAMTFEIDLEHGMPRDKGAIESIFNRGGGKLHYSYFGQETEAWNAASSTRNSQIDRPAGKGDIDVNGGGKFTGFLYSFQGSKGLSGNNPDGNANTFTPTNNAKLYSNINKQATNLAQKMGFRSGG